jgi:hypothetical protein
VKKVDLNANKVGVRKNADSNAKIGGIRCE